MISEKACTKCGAVKPLDAFSKCSRNVTHGRVGPCVSCNAAYRLANLDRIQKYDRERRASDPRKKATDARYRAKNRDRLYALTAALYADRKEKYLATQKARYEKHKAEILESQRRYNERNKAEISLRRSAHKRMNRGIANAREAARKAAKFQATPTWVDKTAVAMIYNNARRLTLETGIPHHVDHIVPLSSKLVCGLHWEANLQILTASENTSKRNRFWPDMPLLVSCDVEI